MGRTLDYAMWTRGEHVEGNVLIDGCGVEGEAEVMEVELEGYAFLQGHCGETGEGSVLVWGEDQGLRFWRMAR